MELVLKTRGVLQRPRVRIPLSPPYDYIIDRIVGEGENPQINGQLRNINILLSMSTDNGDSQKEIGSRPSGFESLSLLHMTI